MTINRFLISIISLSVFSFGFVSNEETAYSSPEQLIANKNGKTVYVCETTAASIAVVDLNTNAVQSRIQLPSEPNGIALKGDDSQIIVTAGSESGTVLFINEKSGSLESSIAVGHTPCSPAFTPDEKKLFVLNRYSNSVSVIDLNSQKVIDEIAVNREPIAAQITPDGALLIIAHHLPSGSASGQYIAARVTLLDVNSHQILRELSLPNGSTSVQDICLSADGKYAYVSHILARYNIPTNQIERGWINTNALSIIDIPKRALYNTVLLDDLDRGAANPHGVACSDNGQWVCVTHAGTHELSVIDRIALHQKLDKVHRGEFVSDACITADDIPNDLTFLVGLRERLPLGGNGPRGILIAGSKAVVTEYFSASLSICDLKNTTPQKIQTIQLADESMNEVRQGEQLFNDASWCLQGWQSCASCHPGNGRVDALNWDLLNDGIGNPKNTKSLLFSHQTPPVMISGVRDRAETAVRAGIKYSLFTKADEQKAQAIDFYLKSLEPLKSPFLENGRLSEPAGIGKTIFQKAGCADCHSGPFFTDLKKYNVGSGSGREQGKEFDTPTLIELWRTGPYLYDGRAKTIREVLTKFNSKDLHGHTLQLTQQEIAQLAEYLVSL